MLRSLTPSVKGLAALVAALILVAGTGPGFCKESKTVAVFPFEMNSPQDLGFLRNGLFSMLSSRLSDAGKVDVLDRETVDKALAAARENPATKGALNEAKARIIGAGLGVDYVLFGSLTNFGESVSLDASMVDVAGKKQTISFFEQSNTMGDVTPLVTALGGDVDDAAVAEAGVDLTAELAAMARAALTAASAWYPYCSAVTMSSTSSI